MIGLRLLAVLMLVGINGFFAAAEFSLVAVRASRVRQLMDAGDRRARIVNDLLSQLDRVVSGVQVGVTLTVGEAVTEDVALKNALWKELDGLFAGVVRIVRELVDNHADQRKTPLASTARRCSSWRE